MEILAIYRNFKAGKRKSQNAFMSAFSVDFCEKQKSEQV